MSIRSVEASELAALARRPAPEASAPANPSSAFAEEVGRALGEANTALNEAEQSARDLAAGKADIVDTMLAMSKADLSLRFVVSLRNRAVEAYQEIMRLQV